MSTITYIVIILIVISIAVTVTEVGLRFAILEKEKSDRGSVGTASAVMRNMGRPFVREDFNRTELEAICGMPIVGKTFAEMEL
jgi:hypothetical protein